MSATIPNPDEFLASFPPQIQALAKQLRTLVKHVVPNSIERVYPGWRLIGYRAVNGRKTHYFCFIAPLSDHVRLGFEYGIELSDNRDILEGDGTQVRYVSIRQPDDIDAERLAALISEAAFVATTRRAR